MSDMSVVVVDDAGTALAEAGPFLRSDPVQNNLVLTLLEARVAHPEPGRYAWVLGGGEVVGVAFQSPLAFQPVSEHLRYQFATRDCILAAGPRPTVGGWHPPEPMGTMRSSPGTTG